MDLNKLKQANQIYASLADKTIDEAMHQLNTFDELDKEVLSLVKSLISNSQQPTDYFEQKVSQHYQTVLSKSWQVGDQIGGYELLSLIGQGGMSMVYKAQRIDSETQKPVAIKLFNLPNQNAELKARFQAEQNILAALSHPNVIDFYHGENTDQGDSYLVMELIDGGLAIDDFVKAQNLNTKQIVVLLIQAAQALQYAHQHLIIHRDVKPSNVMISKSGQLKVLDFGIAKLIKPQSIDLDKSSSEDQAQNTLMALTPSFASPEQINTQAIDITTDVFSLAAVAVYLLTGQQPFPASRMLKSCADDEAHLRKLLKTHIQDHDLRNILTQALQQNSKHRYANMYAFSEDLSAWLVQKPVSASNDSWWYRLNRFAHRRTALFTTALALCVTVMAAIIALGVQNQAIKLEAEKAAAVKNFMLDSFSITDPNTAQGIDITGQELLRIAASKINQDAEMDDQIKFELYESLAIAHAKLGYYPEAISLMKQALQIKANDSAATVRLAEFMFNAGEIESLNALLEDTDSDDFDGELAADFLRVQINLMAQAGAYQQAFELYDQLDEQHNTAAQYLKNRALLAEIYYLKGEADESVRIIEALKNSHPLPATDVFNLGLNSDLVQYLDIAGQFAEAKALTAQNIEIYKEILGDAHPQVGLGYNALSVFQRLDGALKESLQSAKTSEAIFRERYGESSEGLAQALSNQGVAYHFMGQADQAIEKLSAAAQILVDIFSPLHPEAMDAKANLAVILNANDQPQDALPMLEEIYAYELEQFGQGSHTTLYTQMALALTYGNLGQHNKAIAHAKENFSLTQQNFAENANMVNHSEGILGRVFFMADDHENALKHNLNHINNWTEGNKNNHARSLYLIGKSHFALQDFEAAKQFLEQWTQYLSAIYSLTDELYLNAELERATVLIEMQETTAAKALITKVSDTLKAHDLNYEKTQNKLKELNPF